MDERVIWLGQPARSLRHGRMHLCRLIDRETGAILAVTGASSPDRAISEALARKGEFPATLVEVYGAGAWQPLPVESAVQTPWVTAAAGGGA